MNKETREAAARAIREAYSEQCELGLLTENDADILVDAVAPLLEGQLQREVEELRQERERLEREVRAAREVEAPPSLDERIAEAVAERNAFKDYAKRCSDDFYEANRRAVAAEAQLAAARELLRRAVNAGAPALLHGTEIAKNIRQFLSEGRPG